MAENKKFFGAHFVGSEVNFTDANPSTWTLVEKLSERNDQSDEYEYEADKSPSDAWALFRCRNSNDSGNTAIMKIYMQSVPFLSYMTH
jgi:hypothetical protein